MADFTADFEAGVDSATITTGAGEASATAWDFILGSPKYTTEQVAHGSLAAKLVGTDQAYLGWTTLPSPTEYYGRIYFYLTQFPPDNVALIIDNSTSVIRLWSDGTIFLDLAGTLNFTNHVVLNQWMRLEWHVVYSATVGVWEAKLFLDPASPTPTETRSLTNKNTGTAGTGVQFHCNNWGSGKNLYLDDIVANASGWVGPVAAEPQTLVATADSVDGAWTDQAGGSSLAAAIDEATADNADYIRSELAPSNSGCRVKLASGSDPASSSDHTIKWRVGKSAAGGQTINMTVKLYQGGGNSQGAGTLIATFNRNAVTDTITEYTETLSGAEADAITDYSDLYLEFFANAT